MLSFQQFLYTSAKEGDAVNFMFEERLFRLVELVHKAAAMFEAENIEYELIGGMGVAAQMGRVDRDEIILTRDVDIMIRRSDLERIRNAAERHGFHYRHTAGFDMLLPEGETKATRAVHLIFSEEKVKPDQSPNPQISSEPIDLFGQAVNVAPVDELLRMKLNSFRDKDRVHIRAMDSLGMITDEMEQTLHPEMQSRLQHIRATE